MASNTKYHPAAQRDSFEEPNYTQAPPSYQAESSGNNDLLGGPRSEDDNLPDDFKVSDYISQVYGHISNANSSTVWRLRRGGHTTYSNAVCPQGLFDSVGLHPPHM